MGRVKSNSWSAASGQTASIANESKQARRSTASKPDEAVDLRPHEPVLPEAAPIAVTSEKPSTVKRTSTSLYLTPAAHQAIRVHAAQQGVRPHRIYDDALRAYFREHKLGNFDKLNGVEP